MFFLHLLGELPLLYGRVFYAIFQKLCRIRSKKIDIVFDTPISPSIKDLERDRRSMHNQSSAFTITGPLQQRPSDFIGVRRHNQFKESLVAFLVENCKTWLTTHFPLFWKVKSLCHKGTYLLLLSTGWWRNHSC